MNGQKHSQHLVSKGVDELIEKLKNDGIKRGEKEAAKIIKHAELNAETIIERANEEAAHIRDKAKNEASHFQKAGTEAVKTAMRDAVLQLKTELTNEFGRETKNLVNASLVESETIKQIILELVGKLAKETNTREVQQVKILLPKKFLDLDELRNKSETLSNDELVNMVFGITSTMLRKGVEFQFDKNNEIENGLRVVLKDNNIELDLSDEAITNHLLLHLQPRFRAILEGIIR